MPLACYFQKETFCSYTYQEDASSKIYVNATSTSQLCTLVVVKVKTKRYLECIWGTIILFLPSPPCLIFIDKANFDCLVCFFNDMRCLTQCKRPGQVTNSFEFLYPSPQGNNDGNISYSLWKYVFKIIFFFEKLSSSFLDKS